MAFKFQILEGKSEKEPYFSRIVSSNGQTLASSETHVEKRSAKSAIESIIEHAGTAEIEDLTVA